MTVRARDDVTLANVNDVTASIRYYQLKASTASAPTAPTVYPAPSPWVTAEPSYSDGATNSLYTVDVTVFSDGSFDYSTVSLSSSYEAAKAAWNKAQAAQSAASSAQTAAVTAQSSADTAQTAADNAKALASTAQSTANLALANAQELLVNGGFESGLSGWTQSAGAWSTGVLITAPLSGKSYVWPTSLPATGPATLTSQPFTVRSGRTYRVLVSAYQYGTRTLTLTITPGVGTETSKAFVTNDSNNWVPYSLDVTMPAGVSSATLTLASDSINLRLDDVSVKDITEAAAAQSTADTAKTIAGAAQSAADAANSAAKDAQDAASAAQTTADGKNKVVRSTNAPSSTSGYSAGDQWWVYSGGTVTALYLYSGSAWVSQALTDSVISNLDAGKITSGYVDADRIQAGSITGSKVAAGTITASNMVAGTLTAASGIIADAAIGSAQIIDGSIGTAEIADAAIVTAKIGDAQISTAKIADLAVTNAKIGNLDAAKITTGSLDAARIAANSITADKLSANAVTADKIAANTITAREIKSQSITTDNIMAGQFQGYVFTGAVFQSSETADTGIKINSTALQMWDSAHNRTVYLDGEGKNNVLTGSFQTAATGNRIAINSQATSDIIGDSASLSGQSIVFHADDFAGQPAIFGYFTNSDLGDAPRIDLHSGWKTDHDPAATLFLQSWPRSKGATGSGITSTAKMVANTDYTEPDATKRSYASLDLEGIGGSGAYASLEAYAYGGSRAETWVTATRNDGVTQVGIGADAFTQSIYLGGKLRGIVDQQTFQTANWKIFSGTLGAGGTLNPATCALSPAKYGVYHAVANADCGWGSIFVHVLSTGNASQYQVIGYNAGTAAFTGDVWVDAIAWLT